MLRGLHPLIFIVGLLLVVGCSEEPVAPIADAPGATDRHAQVAVTATVSMSLDETTGFWWTDSGGAIHARDVVAEFRLDGRAGSPLVGVGTCTVHLDLDPVTGYGGMYTREDYVLRWGPFNDCFLGRTIWEIDRFEVRGQMLHDGTGSCEGMSLRGAFTGKWGDESFEVIGTLSQ